MRLGRANASQNNTSEYDGWGIDTEEQAKKKEKQIIKESVGGKSKKSSDKFKELYSQDITGIKQILGGMIFFEGGSVVGIQEIIPINYYQKSVSERNYIFDSFKNFFRIAPTTLHFKMRTEKADVEKIVANIKACNSEETSKRILKQAENYIQYIRELQDRDSLCKKFYIIWEYEGEDGKRSGNVNEIYRQMQGVRLKIVNTFTAMGHLCITPQDINWYVTEILYKFFNPKTCNIEPFNARFERIRRDEAFYNAGLKKQYLKEATVADFVSPKGITVKKDYIIMDGVYHTFLTLRDNGHPQKVVTGWTNLLCPGLGYDLDYIVEKCPYDRTLAAIEQYGRIDRVRRKEAVYNKEKFEAIDKAVGNKEFITSRMKNGDEDLWKCLVIITIRANSFQNMVQKKKTLVDFLKARSIYTEDSFLTVWRNFKMVMPFMNKDRELFSKNYRNYLSSSMASLYNYTAYELFDEKGIVIGVNAQNNSLISLDNFNTNMYSSANMMIIGSSGSGKTFTECMLSHRMRLTGMRTFFILPLKGYEYKNAITAMGGDYIKLFPGGRACVNIMQIRPEVKVNKDLLSSDMKKESESLLAKKIASITTFLQLLMQKDRFTVPEINRLNSLITDIYDRFGITNNNASIYRDKKQSVLKEMPILQDLYDALYRDDELSRVSAVLLPFIEGTCQNFNGQTNVALDNKCIAFDVDEDLVGEVFLPAFMYIAFDCVYDLVKQDDLSKDMIFLDEAWKMMHDDDCAKQVQKMIKIVRGYGGGVCIATQDIEDFVNQKNGYGRAIITNTEIQLFLKMKEMEIKTIADIINLNSEDMMKIRKFKRGYGMMYSNGDKILLNLKASPKEIELYTTDINKKQELALKKKKEQLLRKKSGSKTVSQTGKSTAKATGDSKVKANGKRMRNNG